MSTIKLDANNTEPAVTLTHPDASDAVWDTEVLSALKIDLPATPTMRNFLCGIHVKTKGGAIDKGRGILVVNKGKSDGVCIQNDSEYSTGLAILATPNAPNSVNAVIGTALNTQTALELRQETSLYQNAACSTLLSLVASGSIAEMMRFSSTLNNQIGIVFRLVGTDTILLCAKDSGGGDKFVLWGKGAAYFADRVGINTSSFTSPLNVGGLPVHANNAAAVAGGLAAGAFYRTGGDPDHVCVVH